MKAFTLAIIFLIIDQTVSAQEAITGLWYSPDSSRIFKVYHAGEGYEAKLYTSKRVNDKSGVTVLSDVKYNQTKKEYEGLIYAVDDGMPTTVKIRMEPNSSILKLKLHRMFFMPVHIKWYRAI